MSYSYDQLLELAHNAKVPRQYRNIAAAVAMAEHRGHPDPNGVGDKGIQDEKWGPSIGLWQIRSLKPAYLHLEPWRDPARLANPHFNARAMYSISKGGTDFTPWATFKDGLYKQYLRGEPMGCVAAPSCRAALAEATRLWPNRRRTSDGICGDPRHQARVSDHNAGNAWDLSHDPGQGCDAHALVEGIRRRQDKRVKYIISNRRICGPGSHGGGWNWKSYSGSNPHSNHTHVSIWPSARNATGPWFANVPGQVPAPPGSPPTSTPDRPWPGNPSARYGGYNRAEFERKYDGNVEWIQRKLNTDTNLSPKLGPDGRFGPKTEVAVKGFQGARRLKQDAIVGPRTWSHLNAVAP